MQLLSLEITDFKILRDFRIDFTKEFYIQDRQTIIIGENGAGKTTLIECVIRIFSALYDCRMIEDIPMILKGKDGFDFSLSYYIKMERVNTGTSSSTDIRTDYVRVDLSNRSKEGYISLSYADKVLLDTDINNFLFRTQYLLHDLFPKNTVLYYAGFDSRLSNFVTSASEVRIKEWYTQLDHDSMGLAINSPLFVFNPVQFNLLMFAVFCSNEPVITEFIREKFGIIGFTEVTISLKIPTWHRNRPAEDFWGASGILRAALDKFKLASQELVQDKRKISFSYFLPEVLSGLNGGDENSFTDSKEIFQTLVALDIIDLLDGVDIALVKQVDGENIEISSDNLSEGEKQLFSVFGLKHILSTNEESLFLFDEPDTFLHPKWKREFFSNVYFTPSKEFGDTRDSKRVHFGDFDLITTHSPEIIGDIADNDSLRQMVLGRIHRGALYVKGRDYNSILYSAFDSLKRDDYGTRLLENFYQALESGEIERAKAQLAEMKKAFGPDDVEMLKAIDSLEDFG